jgi:UDP-2,4-diacetamido-2,4,6-trideoxy-beta-L-altropyranose hydrolase
MGPLLIRADASAEIGSGHVMRCLALAEAWQDTGGKVCLATRLLPEALKCRWREEQMEVQQLTQSTDDAAETLELARELGADWLVLDGYQFGTEFQQFIKNAGTRLLVVDDDGCAQHYVADLILNQSSGAVRDMYPGYDSHTRLLLGTRFALLRREFLKARSLTRSHAARERNVLVTLGGADPHNCTRTILEAIVLIEGITMIAVVGPNNPRADELAQLAQRGRGRIVIRQNPVDMPQLMARADLAVSAAGSTCWELAFMGLPMLLVVLADNQRPNATSLDELGVAGNLGWHGELSEDKVRAAVMHILDDPALRASMSQKGTALVDGRGASRVVTEMRSRLFTLRRTSAEDSQLLLEWANETGVRGASFSSERISPEEHRIWLTRKLRDPSCALFIASDDRQTPVGQVRFDQEGREAVISVSIDRKFRGHGVGTAVISLACRQLFKETGARSIHAFIKPENVASTRAFADAGFARAEPAILHGRRALHFVLRSNGCVQ